MTTALDAQLETVRAALSDPWRVLVVLKLTRGAVRDGPRSFKIICPWCSAGRHSPPCSVRSTGKGLRVYCFSCQERGDVFELIARVERLNRHDFAAIRGRAAELAHLDFSGVVVPPRIHTPPPRQTSDLDASAWDRGARGLLALCPLEGSVGAGMAFRGILPEAQADGWGELPSNDAEFYDGACDEGEEPETDIPPLDAMLRALRTRALERFVPWLWTDRGNVYKPLHRLLIPWRTPTGQIWMVQRRWAPLYGTEKPPKGERKYTEPNGSRRSPAGPYPYGVDDPTLANAEEIWIVEGATDVLALRALNQRGYLRRDRQPRSMAVLGLPGVVSWTRMESTMTALLAGRAVVIAVDSDAPGETNAPALMTRSRAAGAKTVRDKTPPPDKKDWAEVSASAWKEHKW